MFLAHKRVQTGSKCHATGVIKESMFFQESFFSCFFKVNREAVFKFGPSCVSYPLPSSLDHVTHHTAKNDNRRYSIAPASRQRTCGSSDPTDAPREVRPLRLVRSPDRPVSLKPKTPWAAHTAVPGGGEGALEKVGKVRSLMDLDGLGLIGLSGSKGRRTVTMHDESFERDVLDELLRFWLSSRRFLFEPHSRLKGIPEIGDQLLHKRSTLAFIKFQVKLS